MTVIDEISKQRTRTLEDDELIEAARSHGTPIYIYDLVRLRQRIQSLRRVLEGANATLYFATMANDRAPMLRFMADRGLGACVNSVPHLLLASECGFPDERIQYTSTGISKDSMRLLQARGIRCNLDSMSQLTTWCEMGASEAGVRINASSFRCGLARDRIGIEAAELTSALAAAERRGARISGLHIYVGTNFQKPDEMLPTLEAFFDLAATVTSLSYVNIGGGIGVNYRHDGPEFDIQKFGRGICLFSNRLRNRLRRQIDVIVEPGRGMVASCGTLVTAVTDVKDLGEQRYAAVDASIAVFPRPFHHPESPHRLRKLGKVEVADHAAGELVIVGGTTFSRDILGSMPRSVLNPGDLIAVDDAGAYSQSMASRFLGQPEPEMAFISE